MTTRQNIINEEKLQKMSYTEFISFVNQWNIPPGSLSTVSEWAVFGDVQKDSNVLEIACTTGFSSRELSRLSKCRAMGIDICKDSVEMAKYNHSYYAKELDLRYQCINAYEFEPEEKFTHIIIGAALGFFDDPKKMLQKCVNFFNDQGYILASPYYGAGEMPSSLKEQCKTVIGITPTSTSYEKIKDMYEDFEVLYESRKKIVVETESQMKKYTKDTVDNACKLRGIEDEQLCKIMYDRVYEIKHVCNELRRYQEYSVLVLRYMKSMYPNRYIELF